MTRKDFEALAALLRAEGASRALVERVADWLAAINPRFVRECFVAAALPPPLPPLPEPLP